MKERGVYLTPIDWPAFRKKTTIRAVQIRSIEDHKNIPGDAYPLNTVSYYRKTGFRIQTREGLSDWLPWGYWIATDGHSYWPVAPDFMEANYEPC